MMEKCMRWKKEMKDGEQENAKRYGQAKIMMRGE